MRAFLSSAKKAFARELSSLLETRLLNTHRKKQQTNTLSAAFSAAQRMKFSDQRHIIFSIVTSGRISCELKTPRLLLSLRGICLPWS